MGLLQNIDAYRRVPTDLTQGSDIGGLCTVLAFVFICIVVVLEIISFVDLEHEGHIELDHDLENGVYLNFNLTIDEISCDLLQVDIIDMFANKPHQVPTGSVNKMSQEGRFKGSGLRSEWINPVIEAKDPKNKLPSYLLPKTNEHLEEKEIQITAEEERQMKAGKQLVKTIDEKTFDEELLSDDMVIVFFHAEWSRKSKEFEQVFQQAAYQTSQRTKKVVFKEFDCSLSRKAMDRCSDRNVQGLPSVYIYDKDARFHPFDDALFVYNGRRTPEALSTYFYYLQLFKEEDKAKMEEIENEVKATGGDSVIHSKGCRIEASVPMNKVPTEVIIKAVSHFHDVNSSLYTVSHTMHHLSVGRMLPEFRMVTTKQRDNVELLHKRNAEFKEKVRDIRDQISFAYYNTYGRRAKDRVEKGRMIGLKSETGHDFKSRGPLAYDHYVRVVPLSLFPKGEKEINDFDYTFITDRYTANFGSTPQITLRVEMSPMRIVLEEKYKSLSSSFLNLMAVIGGVYSSFLIAERVLHTTLRVLVKKRD